MGIPGNLSAQSLEGGLGERVQFIVSESVDFDKDTTRLPVSFAFENPGLLPELSSPKKISNLFTPGIPENALAQSGVSTVMQNLGAEIYMTAKASGSLLGLQVPGIGVVPVTSPRTGVIQIGSGMFQLNPGVAGLDSSSPALALFRLMVLFHEARHSDGNGRSVGFVHAFCPLGHDYEGSASCDLALNGAYALGAKVIRNLAASCPNCSTAERESLKLQALDSFSRLLKEGQRYVNQGHDQVLCQSIARSHAPVTAEDREYCNLLLSKPIEMVKASNWDARPEGKRQQLQ
jgi:hypothetical protein